MAPANEGVLQLQKILNDAVVHQGNTTVATRMGVGVSENGTAVGGPAGMPQAQGAPGTPPVKGRYQVPHTPDGLMEFRPLVRPQRHHAGAVVAAVFQPLQTLLN
jgi:hypothetical protein